jgi:hypothetical protein
MKPLDAGQAALLAGTALSVVTLCKLTTYSDRAALTVQATRYFSDGARLYDWANLGTTQQFEPWLLKLDPGRDTMNHLPSMSGGGIESALRRRRMITLRNWQPETGTYLYQTLRAENLEHSRIEIAQVFVDRGAGASFNDLSALVGTEQTWIFRGEVASVGAGNEQKIVLECVAELPQIPWIYADVPSTNDPRDLGNRLPICLGSVKRVKCVGWSVGWTTTLAGAAISGSSTLLLTDASGLAASATNGARVGTNLISWTGNSGNILTGVSGMLNGQSAGQLLVEVVTSGVWIASAIRASAISNVYVSDPYTGALTRLTSPYTIRLADVTTISGKTVASITLTSSEIQAMLDSLAQVGQKPAIVGVLQETRRATDDDLAVGAAGNAMRDGSLITGDVTPARTYMTWPAVSGRVLTEVTYEVYATLLTTGIIQFHWPSGSSVVYTITNSAAGTVTDWWRWTTNTESYMGTTMGFVCSASSSIQQVRRVETYTGGPVRVAETRVATSQVTSAHASWDLTVDGDLTTGITSPAVQLGYRYTPVEGRVLVEVVHRAYLSLQTADSWTLRTTSAGANVFSADNVTGATTVEWFEYATTVPAEMDTDIYMTVTTGSIIYEVERIEIWEESEGEVEIKSARVGLGLELFADVDGPTTDYTWSAGYGWDDTTGWSVLNGTRTDETTIKTEGTESQKFVCSAPTAPTLILNCDSDQSSWGHVNVSVSNNGSVYQVGKSIKITTSNSNEGHAWRVFSSNQDFTGCVLRLGMYFVSGYFTGAEEKVWIYLSNTTGFSTTNYRMWQIGAADIAYDTWNTMTFDPLVADGSAGSINTGSSIWIYTNKVAPKTSGDVLYIDEVYRVPTQLTILQRNATTGTLNLAADGNAYRVDVRGDTVDPGATLRVYFSNTAGVTTTKPATYWYFDIGAIELTSGAFVTIEKTATAFGAAVSPTDVETVGFEVLGIKTGTVYVDNLQKRVATPTTSYSVAGGVLIDKAPDMLRYVLADLCALGHGALDSSFATLCGATYLDDNAHGVDLRELGENVLDVLAALSYESRANLVADERTAATTYRLAAALSTYAWPALVEGVNGRTLTKWQVLTEEGRDADALLTRTRYLYQWRADLGRGADAFLSAVQTTVAAAETKFGRHDASAVGLLSIESAATATEIAGYYSQELARVAALWRINGVPWQDGYDLERGDLVQFTPPWATLKKARVIETVLRTDGLIDLLVVEVT